MSYPVGIKLLHALVGVLALALLVAVSSPVSSAITRNRMALRFFQNLQHGLDISALEPIVASAEHGSRNRPGDPATRRLLGYFYLISDEPQKAASVLGAEGSDCHDPITCLELGYARYDMGQHEAALAAWRSVPNIDSYFALGDGASGPFRDGDTREWYEVSWEIDSRPGRQKTPMFLELCRLRRESGAYEEAIDSCLRAVESQPNYWSLDELGRTYYEARQYEQAEQVLREAIDGAPEAASAYQWLGLTLHRTGEKEQAVESLRTAVRLAPENVWMRLDLGNILQLQGQDLAAGCQYLQALALAEQPGLVTSIEERIASLSIMQEEILGCEE